jgi:pseudaminic acid synthase
VINPIEINKHQIGPGFPVYVVAEISANHNQDFKQAVRLVRAAKEAGVDAVKLQTYTPDTLTIKCDNEYFRIGKGTIWEGKTLYDLYEEAYTPWDWQPKLKKIANDLGIDLFSTPFDKTAVDFLEKMDVPAYKIASFELVDISLIQYIARTGKPILLSTGMATLKEIDEAVTAAREAGCNEIALLKCTSAYPADPAEMNLRTIPHLAEAFGVPVGLSDHTLGIAVSVTAVALGASVIEKHFTLNRKDGGVDASFSLEPLEMGALVCETNQAWQALGRVSYGPTDQEKNSLVYRRSLYITRDLKSGDVLTRDNVRAIRPGHGLPPKYLDVILGKKVNRDVQKGTPLEWEIL